MNEKGEDMKKFIIGLIILGLIVAGYFIFKDNGKKESELQKIKVGEVTHSIFYAPQYAADALGFFEDEGLDVDFILTSGETKKKW